jgi:hypothetical protein
MDIVTVRMAQPEDLHGYATAFPCVVPTTQACQERPEWAGDSARRSRG